MGFRSILKPTLLGNAVYLVANVVALKYTRHSRITPPPPSSGAAHCLFYEDNISVGRQSSFCFTRVFTRERSGYAVFAHIVIHDISGASISSFLSIAIVDLVAVRETAYTMLIQRFGSSSRLTSLSRRQIL